MPELENLKPVITKRVFDEMKVSGLRGSKQDLQKMHRDRTVEIVSFLSVRFTSRHFNIISFPAVSKAKGAFQTVQMQSTAVYPHTSIISASIFCWIHGGLEPTLTRSNTL
jgi:hypothetical protein